MTIYQVSGSLERSCAVPTTDVMTTAGNTQRMLRYPYTSVMKTGSIAVASSVTRGRESAGRQLSDRKLGVVRTSTESIVVPLTASGVQTDVQATIGKNHSSVVTSFSSSNHEVVVHNAFRSGTTPYESSPVPASGSSYYSKVSGYKTVTYKYKTTSADGGWDSLLGSLVSYTSSIDAPKSFFINVNETGRLINLRVWIEAVHLSASVGQGSAGHPLDLFGCSITSPHVSWEGHHAHPIRNDPFYRSWLTSSIVPAKFYRDSFLLWEGGAFSDLTLSFYLANYPTWGKDRSMRVVFDDSSEIPNPRHMSLGRSPWLNTNGAPNSSGSVFATPVVSGNDYPWFSETSIAGTGSNYGRTGSPPVGWLSGPGGTTGSNEWLTTGSNYGAPTIRPLYPLLDPIVQRKEYFEIKAGAPSPKDYDHQNWYGKRPGLRGSEISGTWEVMFAYPRGASIVPTMNLYVRQMRLEITYETGLGDPQGRSKFFSDAMTPRRPGRRSVTFISGSDTSTYDGNPSSQAGQDYYLNQVLTIDPDQPGRSFGIATTSGALSSGDYALFYSLSGTLADVSGSTPWWLLSGFGGVPTIPDSSGSLTEPSVADEAAPSPTDILNPSSGLIPLTIREAAVAENPPMTLVNIASRIARSASLR